MNFNVNSLKVYSQKTENLKQKETKQEEPEKQQTGNKESKTQEKQEPVKVNSVSANEILAIYNTTILPRGTEIKPVDKKNYEPLPAVDKGCEVSETDSGNLRTGDGETATPQEVVDYCIRYNENVNNQKLMDDPSGDNIDTINNNIADFKKQFFGEFPSLNETSIENLDSDIDVNIKIAYLEVMLRFAKRYVRWADLFSDEDAQKAAREMNDKYQNMLDRLHGLEGATVSDSEFDPN